MERELIVTLVAWWIASGLVLWVLVPPLACLLGHSRIDQFDEAGPQDLWAERYWPWLAAIYQKLENAGFQPLGRVRMRMRFEGVKWSANITERLYATDDVLVSIYQLLPFEPPRFAASSIFTDGKVLSTSATMPEIVVDEPGYIRWGFETTDPLRLLEAHRRRVKELVDRGETLASPRGLDIHRRMAQAEWNSTHCKNLFRGLAWENLQGMGWWAICFGLAVVQEPGWLRGACAVIALVTLHVGFRYATYAYLTLQNWFSRKGTLQDA